jgi:hypothetical protein
MKPHIALVIAAIVSGLAICSMASQTVALNVGPETRSDSFFVGAGEAKSPPVGAAERPGAILTRPFIQWIRP